MYVFLCLKSKNKSQKQENSTSTDDMLAGADAMNGSKVKALLFNCFNKSIEINYNLPLYCIKGIKTNY